MIPPHHYPNNARVHRLVSMLNINELYTELKPSTVCPGVGVFAIKDIAEGTDVFFNSRKDTFYSWKLVTDSAVAELIAKLCHVNSDGFYISDHPVNLGMSYYVNHSLTPNVIFDEIKDTYFTLTDIAKGEELLACYKQEEQDWLI